MKARELKFITKRIFSKDGRSEDAVLSFSLYESVFHSLLSLTFLT